MWNAFYNIKAYITILLYISRFKKNGGLHLFHDKLSINEQTVFYKHEYNKVLKVCAQTWQISWVELQKGTAKPWSLLRRQLSNQVQVVHHGHIRGAQKPLYVDIDVLHMYILYLNWGCINNLICFLLVHISLGKMKQLDVVVSPNPNGS